MGVWVIVIYNDIIIACYLCPPLYTWHNGFFTRQGGLLLYPTDTVWGIGCDATNADAIDKVYALKKRKESKALICLVSDMKMLNQFVEEIPEVAYNILKYADQPTTIIYDKPIRVAENLVGEDNTLGIRIVQDEFCRSLISSAATPPPKST